MVLPFLFFVIYKLWFVYYYAYTYKVTSMISVVKKQFQITLNVAPTVGIIGPLLLLIKVCKFLLQGWSVKLLILFLILISLTINIINFELVTTWSIFIYNFVYCKTSTKCCLGRELFKIMTWKMRTNTSVSDVHQLTIT